MIRSLFDKPQPAVVFEVHSLRQYGQSKLSKPKELRGIKQSFSVEYIPRKCRCAIFINGNDVWVKHTDYFSECMRLPNNETGAPLEYVANKYANRHRGKKFVYGDAWGAIVLRNEAWICLRGLLDDSSNNIFILDILASILRQQEREHGFEEGDLLCTDMERFWERLLLKITQERR